MKPAAKNESTASVTQNAPNKIAQAASVLVAPSTALFFECHQEYVRAGLSELYALNAAIEDARLKGLAAVTLLLLIDAPQPVITRRHYADIIADDIAGGAA